MKLFQILVSSNSESVSLKKSMHMKTLRLKSIYFMNKANLSATETSCLVEISFLREGVNVHTNLNNDVVIMPLDSTASTRLSKKEYDIVFNEVNVPQQFQVNIYNADGTAFDNTKIGEVLISLESDGK